HSSRTERAADRLDRRSHRGTYRCTGSFRRGTAWFGGEKSRGRLEDLVGPAQLGVLAPQPPQFLDVLAGHTRLLAVIDVLLLGPVTDRLVRDAQGRSHVLERAGARRVLGASMVLDHPDRPLFEVRAVLLRHVPILQANGSELNPGRFNHRRAALAAGVFPHVLIDSQVTHPGQVSRVVVGQAAHGRQCEFVDGVPAQPEQAADGRYRHFVDRETLEDPAGTAAGRSRSRAGHMVDAAAVDRSHAVSVFTDQTRYSYPEAGGVATDGQIGQDAVDVIAQPPGLPAARAHIVGHDRPAVDECGGLADRRVGDRHTEFDGSADRVGDGVSRLQGGSCGRGWKLRNSHPHTTGPAYMLRSPPDPTKIQLRTPDPEEPLYRDAAASSKSHAMTRAPGSVTSRAA